MRYAANCLQHCPRFIRAKPCASHIRAYSTSRILCNGGPLWHRSSRPEQNQNQNQICARHKIRAQIEALARSRSRRRWFSATPVARHGHLDPPKPGEELHVTFIDKDNSHHTFTVAKGDNLLDIAQANDLEMEGACGGSCACSTCHIILTDADTYDKLPEPEDDENDMLDLAFGLTETSRLGCQVKMTEEIDGLVVRLPSMTRNLQKSDFGEGGKREEEGG